MLFGVSSTELRQQPIWCGTIRAVLRYPPNERRASLAPAPPNERRTSGGLCLFNGKHAGILTDLQTKVNEKANTKNSPQRSVITQRKI